MFNPKLNCNQSISILSPRSRIKKEREAEIKINEFKKSIVALSKVRRAEKVEEFIDELTDEDKELFIQVCVNNGRLGLLASQEFCKQCKENKPVWDSYIGLKDIGEFTGPFRYSLDLLLWISQVKPPEYLGQRVTDFTNWIMRLHLKKADKDSLHEGKVVEQSIAGFTKLMPKKEWELVYRDPLNDRASSFKISSLLVNGDPLYGRPDLVYRYKPTNEIVIVEHKSSNMDIPCDGWPNLKAQLWAYGHIDEFQHASKVHLVGEVWGYQYGGVFRRTIQHWELKQKEFYCQSQALFEAYGGIVKDPLI